MGHCGDVEDSVLLADFGVEEYMEEHIAELLADFGIILADEGVAELVDLLDGVGTQRLVGLRGIPGALHTQGVEYIHYPRDSFELLLPGVGTVFCLRVVHFFD